MRGAGALILGAVIVAACTSSTDVTRTPARIDDPLETMRSVTDAARDPHLPRLLSASSQAGFTRDSEFYASAGWRAADRHDFAHVGARVPARADQATYIGVSRVARHSLRLTLAGARAAPATLDEGRIVYRDALPDTDLVAVASEDRFEHLFLLRTPAAETVVRYDVELAHGLRGVRKEGSGAAVFVDARGDATLRVLRPYAIDAHGMRRDAELEATTDHLTVRLDARGLVPPIVLDPAMEVPVWEQLAVTTSPPGRASYGMAYDSVRGKTIVFGGFRLDSSVASANWTLGDMWSFDGTTWVNLTPKTLPGKRSAHAFEFDAGRGVAVLFGGNGCSSATNCTSMTTLADLWEWNGTSWSMKTAPKTGPWPTARYNHGLVYDSGRQRLVMFGGYGCVDAGCTSSDELSDTWEYDGTTWTNRTPAVSPPKRDSFAMTYDAARARTVVFGGVGCSDSACSQYVDLGDTWEWDGTTWTQMATPIAPGARTDSPLVYDAATHKSVLHNGYVATDTWQWDGSAWAQLFPSSGPDPLSSHQMVYVPSRKRTLLWGGWEFVTTDGYSEKTWEYRTHGGSCTTVNDCDTAYCVDGVCCEQASCGTCQACNTAASPGVCAPVMNGEDADTCALALNGNACDAQGACKKGFGSACPGGPSDCATGLCVDGFCCNSACAGSCDVCAKSLGAPSDGQCGTATAGYAGSPSCGNYVCSGTTGSVCPTSCTSDSACAPSAYCNLDGACVPRKPLGNACDPRAGADCLQGDCRVCASGYCVDGFCCDGACTGSCDVCAQALGATADGTCSPAMKGYLGAPTCAPFTCGGSSTSCETSCTGSSDCAPGSFCVDGTCKGQQPLGTACGTDAACANGHCADGVCCDKACTGQCEACDLPTATGTCAAVVGAPHGARAACAPGSPSEPCSAAACDGTVREQCVGRAGSSVTCRSATCVDGVATFAATCDGKGGCPDVTSRCEPYACGGDSCKSSCAGDGDCAAGSTCDAQSGKCLSGATCDPDGKTVVGGGGERTTCAPYRCESGECRTTCRSVADCVYPASCDEAGRCVVLPPEAPAPSGCASVPGTRGDAPSIAVAALSLIAWRRRLRKRSAAR